MNTQLIICIIIFVASLILYATNKLPMGVVGMSTIVALVMAIVIGNTIVQILAGLGIVYVMYFHDDIIKANVEKTLREEFKAGVRHAEEDIENGEDE